MATGEPFDLSVFYAGADMDVVTASLRDAGASNEASMAAHDLVRSGVFNMGADVSAGGYAIFGISPLIVRGGIVTIEPVEFGARNILPEQADWARANTDLTAVGNRRDRLGEILHPTVTDLFRSLTFKLSTALGVPSLEKVKYDAGELPSQMIGGIVSGALFFPHPEIVKPSTIPFWHESLSETLNFSGLLEEAPRIMRRRLERITRDPDHAAGIALIQLFGEAAMKRTVATDEIVTLGLPPK